MRWKPFSSEYKKKGFESLNVLLETLKVTRKSLNMMSAWKPLDQPCLCFFPSSPALSGGKHPGEGGCCSSTQEADPQPQEHQLVQTAL